MKNQSQPFITMATTHSLPAASVSSLPTTTNITITTSSLPATTMVTRQSQPAVAMVTTHSSPVVTMETTYSLPTPSQQTPARQLQLTPNSQLLFADATAPEPLEVCMILQVIWNGNVTMLKLIKLAKIICMYYHGG